MIKLLTVLFLTITVNFNFAFASESKPKSSCAPNQHWVRSHNQREYVKADGTFVRASFRAAHCQNNPKSYAFWRDKLTNVRPPNWPDANKSEKHKKWTDEEIERMLEALNELPEVLWVRTIKSISRMDKSIYQNNPGSGDLVILLSMMKPS